MSAHTTSAHGAHSRENEILGEHEALLDAAVPPGASPDLASRGPAAVWRVVPLALLVAVGAVLAFVSVDVKDVLMTGRSVAHAPRR